MIDDKTLYIFFLNSKGRNVCNFCCWDHNGAKGGQEGFKVGILGVNEPL